MNEADKLFYGIENHHGLVRDGFSKAVINCDDNELRKAKEAKEKAIAKAKHQESQNDKINTLETRLDKIEGLLKQLLEKK